MLVVGGWSAVCQSLVMSPAMSPTAAMRLPAIPVVGNEPAWPVALGTALLDSQV